MGVYSAHKTWAEIQPRLSAYAMQDKGGCVKLDLGLVF